MAEAIVFSLLQKLGEVVIKEAIFLSGVKDQIEVMKRELVCIQCFLKDADSKSKRKDSESVQNWVKNVRDVSYWIEDVIDTFIVEVRQVPPKKPGMVNKFKRLGKKTEKAILLHKLGDDINKIQARLAEISSRTEMYGINKDLGKSSGEPENLLKRKLVVPNIDKDIIGFETEKKEIIERLLDQNVLKRRVVSIVGQGGLGKTTLAQKLYNSADIKNHFDIRIWLTISQEFEPIQLLKEVLRQLQKGEKIQTERDISIQSFIDEIHELLSNKKYFVVLDDIWKDLVWIELFEQVFLDLKNGSRILITTRFLTIAKKANPKGIHELQFMNNEESLELLFKKAYPIENVSECYPPDLYELAKEFLKPCGGLPLALVVVGGLLSTKLPTYDDWRKVLNNMNWQSEKNECLQIIATSYEDLPLHLKSCFMYFASFPEDYEVDASLLIMMWIAEGFIPNENKSMEETAEDYLDELVQRCMIQVSNRSRFKRYSEVEDSIVVVRVHDILLGLAISEAQQNNFFKVFSKQKDLESISDARRTTFHLGDPSGINVSSKTNNLMEYTKPSVRTLIFFEKVIPFDSQFRLLRVLFLQNYGSRRDRKPDLMNGLKGLFHLRCLVFINCYFNLFVLPIGDLHNLQTLHVEQCRGIIVPSALLDIKTLRHVSCDKIFIASCDTINYTINGFPGDDVTLDGLDLIKHSFPNRELPFTDLPYLITLENLCIYKPTEIEMILGKMPNLQKLTLGNYHDSWQLIATFIGKLNCLVYLHIVADGHDKNIAFDLDMNWEIPLEIIDMKAFSCYLHLQTLHLRGKFNLKGVPLNTDMFPPHLCKLVLCGSDLSQDPMPILEKLQSLKVLQLMDFPYWGYNIIISEGGFPRLQESKLQLFNNLVEWKIEVGALPMLNYLSISWCRELQMLPDLQHVSSLKVLELDNMTDEIILRLQNEDRHKTDHIPSIIINRTWTYLDDQELDDQEI